MIKAILIDDEKNALKMLRWLLEKHCPDVEICAECGNAEEGMKVIIEKIPDLVFLDIEMPKMNGFEMLRRIGDVNFEVIFTTAYDQFALNAFKVSALDYLLKPVDGEELKSAVEKFKRKTSALSKEQLDLLFASLNHLHHPAGKIAVPTSEGLEFLKVDEILRCEADSNYTTLYLTGKRSVLVSRTLKEFDELLTPYDFFRIHQSHLINLRYISKYIRGEGGQVVMEDNSVLSVSRSKRDPLLEKLKSKK